MDSSSARKVLERSELDVIEMEEIEEGSDDLFRFRTMSGWKVAKFHGGKFLDKKQFCKEPLALEILAHSCFPVPEVAFKDCSNDPPFFVMEKLEGESLSKAKRSMGQKNLYRVVEEAADILELIHSREVKIGEKCGEVVADGEDLVIDSDKVWKERFSLISEEKCNTLSNTEFASYSQDLIKLVSESMENLGLRGRSYLHGDFRPGNILVKDTEISGIMDWGRLEIGDPLFDVIRAEYHFRTEMPMLEEDRIIEQFSGRIDISGEKRRLYMAVSVAGRMIGFSEHWKELLSDQRRRELQNKLDNDLNSVLY